MREDSLHWVWLSCRLEAECGKLEQRNLEESNVRNVAKLAMERNSQETERIIAEAKQEKIRYLDEAHSANRKVTELQTRLKLVENRLAEKEAMIRAYQGQKSEYKRVVGGEDHVG